MTTDPYRRIKSIAFFGDAQTPPDHPDYQEAFQLAQALAGKGYGIVNGGGPGIMDASTQGAESVNGQTIAVTFSPKKTSSFEGRYLKNLNRVDQEIVTTNYIERMYSLIEHSDMFVIFRGGSGTLSEFGTVWVLANIYHGHHKPFLLYGSFWWEIIQAIHQNLNIDDQEMDCFRIVETPEQALVAIERLDWHISQIHSNRSQASPEDAFMT